VVFWWLSDLQQRAERSGSYWSLEKKVNLGVKWEKERSWKEQERDPFFLR